MHTPPRAILALIVALSLVATALPLNLPGPLGPFAASATSTLPGKAARGAILQQFSTDGHAPVGPGVDHTWGTIVTGTGQQVVHIVNVAAGAPGITIEAGLSNDAALGLERSSRPGEPQERGRPSRPRGDQRRRVVEQQRRSTRRSVRAPYPGRRADGRATECAAGVRPRRRRQADHRSARRLDEPDHARRLLSRHRPHQPAPTGRRDRPVHAALRLRDGPRRVGDRAGAERRAASAAHKRQRRGHRRRRAACQWRQSHRPGHGRRHRPGVVLPRLTRDRQHRAADDLDHRRVVVRDPGGRGSRAAAPRRQHLHLAASLDRRPAPPAHRRRRPGRRERDPGDSGRPRRRLQHGGDGFRAGCAAARPGSRGRRQPRRRRVDRDGRAEARRRVRVDREPPV